jgi:hypothetical protein
MEEQQDSKSIQLQLWGAFLAAILIYVLVGYQKLTGGGQPVAFVSGDLFQSVFLAVVIFSGLLIGAVHRYIPELMPAPDSKKLLVRRLIQYGLSEIPAIVGLILFFSKGSFSQLVVLCALSFLSIAILMPKDEAV